MLFFFFKTILYKSNASEMHEFPMRYGLNFTDKGNQSLFILFLKTKMLSMRNARETHSAIFISIPAISWLFATTTLDICWYGNQIKRFRWIK